MLTPKQRAAITSDMNRAKGFIARRTKAYHDDIEHYQRTVKDCEARLVEDDVERQNSEAAKHDANAEEMGLGKPASAGRKGRL